MCIVSDRLRLCTCISANPENLKHYWVFFRRNKTKNLMIMGEPMIPVFLDFETQIANRATLEKLLKAGASFDCDIHPKQGDRLLFAFTFPSEVTHIYYGFRYSSKKWISFDFDPFEWQWKHDEEAFGKITNALR